MVVCLINVLVLNMGRDINEVPDIPLGLVVFLSDHSIISL